jgi:hypothetical protein
MQAATLGTKRSFQSIPSLSRASFTGPSICRFQRRFYFQSSSPIKKLAIKLAKPLPVVRLQKLTPLKKIDRCFKIKAIIPDNKVVNDIIEAPVWQKVSAVLGLGAIASLNPFTTLYISQYAGKTTPMDVWRQILWGAKAAKKGRPASEERIVNALLRVSNAGSPGELFNAVLMALLLFLLAYWWKQGELKDVEPVKIDPPPPTPPGAHQRFWPEQFPRRHHGEGRV